MLYAYNISEWIIYQVCQINVYINFKDLQFLYNSLYLYIIIDINICYEIYQ